MEWNHWLPKACFPDLPVGQWLTLKQHAIASALQTLAFKKNCLCGWHKKHLPKSLLDLVWHYYNASASENGSKGLSALIARNPDHQTEAGKIGGKVGSKEGKRVGGVKCKEKSLGMFSLTDVERSSVSSEAAKKVNAQKWADPVHPELGLRSAATLVQMQSRRGLPHGKENRVRVY
jgi:hypothetical protein